jgi:hypothetical protein
MRNVIAAAVVVALSTTACPAHAAPTAGCTKARVSRSIFGVTITCVQRTDTLDIRRWDEDDNDRPSDRSRRSAKRVVAKRPLTAHEQAVILAARREVCLRAIRQAVAGGGTLSADRCSIVTDPVTPTRPSIAQINATIVLTEVRQLNFPASVVHIQPRGGTLVNLDTNVYADPKTVNRVVPVLTWPVEIRATPASYTWRFGDGSTETTDNPGAPHPNAIVTHKYLKRGEATVSVTLNYDTWYQVPGGDWQRAGIVSIPGPGTPVTICEARPVLTDPDNTAPTDVEEEKATLCAGR